MDVDVCDRGGGGVVVRARGVLWVSFFVFFVWIFGIRLASAFI